MRVEAITPPQPSAAALFADACALLVAIAGPHEWHAEMNQPGKKYGPVYHPFGLDDAAAHLRRKSTRAAWIARPDGMTRALCFDGDSQAGGESLRSAARRLYDAGYLPLWEPSPARDHHAGGGHLWLIYMGLVDARCAKRHVCEIAPDLASGFECWPGESRNVRLPGGVYVTPDFREPCTLWDRDQLVASTARDVATALLLYQTPSVLVPAYAPDPEPDLKVASRPTTPQLLAPGAGEIAFTYGQLAAWFNDRNRVETILRPAIGCKAFPIWRDHGPEPHVHLYLQTNTWCDFGNKGDGGDALELYLRTQGVLRGDTSENCPRKKALLADLGREYRAGLISRKETPGEREQAAGTGGVIAFPPSRVDLDKAERMRRYAM